MTDRLGHLLLVTLRCLRPNRPLSALAQRPGDLDRFAAQHQLRRLEENFVLGGADLAFDDVDGQVFATQEARDAVPDARGALAGVHATQRDERRARRPGARLSRHVRVVRRAGGRLGQPDGVGMGGPGGSYFSGFSGSSGGGVFMAGRLR